MAGWAMLCPEFPKFGKGWAGGQAGKRCKRAKDAHGQKMQPMQKSSQKQKGVWEFGKSIIIILLLYYYYLLASSCVSVRSVYSAHAHRVQFFTLQSWEIF